MFNVFFGSTRIKTVQNETGLTEKKGCKSISLCIFFSSEHFNRKQDKQTATALEIRGCQAGRAFNNCPQEPRVDGATYMTIKIIFYQKKRKLNLIGSFILQKIKKSFWVNAPF